MCDAKGPRKPCKWFSSVIENIVMIIMEQNITSNITLCYDQAKYDSELYIFYLFKEQTIILYSTFRCLVDIHMTICLLEHVNNDVTAADASNYRSS